MADEPEKDSLLEDAAARVAAARQRVEAEAAAAGARAAAEAAAASARGAVSAAASAASKAGDGLLDALEVALFGKVGEADRVLRREASADPLERLRAQYGASGEEVEAATAPPKPARPPTVDERLEKAKVELERLKAAKAAAAAGDGAQGPGKKTL